MVIEQKVNNVCKVVTPITKHKLMTNWCKMFDLGYLMCILHPIIKHMVGKMCLGFIETHT